MVVRRYWIPPGALFFAQFAHGVSWAILLWAAIARPSWTLDGIAIAWIHTVALGWATTTALAVLIHVIPQFTDTRWQFETLARRSVVAFGAGVVLFVAAALLRPTSLAAGAAVMLLALLAYLFAALLTLRQALRGERVERAIARAFGATLLFLLLTALAGTALAAMLSGYTMPAWIAALPAAHADLGMYGWLSLLIFGVSARTVRPIAGHKSRFPIVHVAVGSLCLAGVVLLAIGLSAVPVLAWPGALLVALGALAYAIDLCDIVRRATVPHRVPQAFLLAGAAWLLAGIALGAGTLAGHPWQLAYGFVLLGGWAGQTIDAHVYHIGVRLLLTIYRGDDDETRPQTVLDARLSWLSFLAFQLAIASGAAGLLARSAPALAAGAALGLCGWILMLGNLAVARERAAAGATTRSSPSV